MSEDLGAGPALDENFDFSIGPTGDLTHVKGVAEVEKDLAANMAVELDDYIGRQTTPGIRAEIINDAAITANLDERVEDVDKDKSSASFEDGGTIIVELSVTIEDEGEYDLVFEV